MKYMMAKIKQIVAPPQNGQYGFAPMALTIKYMIVNSADKIAHKMAIISSCNATGNNFLMVIESFDLPSTESSCW